MVQSASQTTTPSGSVSRTAASASGPSRAAVDPVTTPPPNPMGTPPLRGRAKATHRTAATVTFWSPPPGGPSRRPRPSPGGAGRDPQPAGTLPGCPRAGPRPPEALPQLGSPRVRLFLPVPRVTVGEPDQPPGLA